MSAELAEAAPEGMRAKSGMRTRCEPSGRDGEHERARGNDDAVAIVRLRSSRRYRRHVSVARTRWASGDDDSTAIVRLRSSCRRRYRVAVASARGEGGPGRGGQVVTATVCGPGRGNGGVRTKWA